MLRPLSSRGAGRVPESVRNAKGDGVYEVFDVVVDCAEMPAGIFPRKNRRTRAHIGLAAGWYTLLIDVDRPTQGEAHAIVEFATAQRVEVKPARP